MNCEQFLDALTQAVREDERADSGLSHHAAGCPECGPLWQAEQLLRAAPVVQRSLALPHALAHALRETGPTRVFGARARLLGPIGAGAFCLALICVLAPRADLLAALGSDVLLARGTARFELVLPVVVQLLLFVGLLGLFRFRGATGLGAPSWLRWLAVLLSIAAFHLMVLAQAAPFSLVRDPGLPLPPRDCLLLGLMAGGLIGAIAVGFSRYSVLTGPSAAGALVGCSAGYAALAMLQLHCPSTFALHLHVAHGLPLVLLVIVGALWGRRWLTV